MTTKSMTVNKKEVKLSRKQKAYRCTGGSQNHGASFGAAVQGKRMNKDSKDEERAMKAYSVLQGQTNDEKRVEMSAKHETQYRVEVGR